MYKSRALLGTLGLAAAIALGGTACSPGDQANAALEQAGVDANVSTGGDLPDGFPEDVAAPELDLENGAGVAGVYTLRYTSPDPVDDAAAYRSELEGSGFAIGDDFAFDKASGDHQGFTAENSEFSVLVSSYGPDAPGGGNYLAVVVTPV